MTHTELCRTLLASDRVEDVRRTIVQFEEANAGRVSWAPVGRSENNRGPIEVASDPGRSLVERLTNAIDALLDHEYVRRNGTPEVRNPYEGARAWFSVPRDGGLSALSKAKRRELAHLAEIKITEGDGRERRTITVRDHGIGIAAVEMPRTILSLNQGNKRRKAHLMGAYGQGGSSTFAVSTFTLIVTRAEGLAPGFTVVRFQPPGSEDAEDKLGEYVYLCVDGDVPSAELADDEFARGTLVRHFGYDLSGYPSPLGPNSVYGLLNQTLFDPVLPVWLEIPFLNPAQKRVIKGARNALNGATDEGDEGKAKLAHKMPLFFDDLPPYGSIGLEYWLLPPPSEKNKRPSAAYVNPSTPVVFTRLGQAHALQPASWIRKDAGYLYLAQRLVVHVECNEMNNDGKRALFLSNREDARRGAVLEMVKSKIIEFLKTDDVLKDLNEKAKHQNLRERSESVDKEMRKEVARLLKLQGVDLEEDVPGLMAAAVGTPRDERPEDDDVDPPSPPTPRVPKPIEIKEPPDFIKIVHGSETKKPPIRFHPGRRRYIRIETNAGDHYHDPRNKAASRINIIVPEFLKPEPGTTPLVGGRMRIMADALADAAVGATGVLRVELSVPGRPVLSDERPIEVVEPPPAKPTSKKLALPEIKGVPIDPGHEMWATLGWPDEPNQVASESDMSDGRLTIHYSTVFPAYASRLAVCERKGPAVAAEFNKRYEIWLAVHAMLLHEAERKGQSPRLDDIPEEVRLVAERVECCRVATLAALFASREASSGAVRGANDEDD